MDDGRLPDPSDAFNERVAAFVLDWLVLGGLAFGAAGGGGAGAAAAVVVSLLNQGVAQALTGWTLGKSIAGVRSARLDTVEPPGIGPGLLRWLFLWVDLLVVGLVGLFVASRSPRRQRLGDLAAKTWVVGIAPPQRARSIAGLAYAALCLVFVFLWSTAAGWAVTGVFAPVAIGAVIIVSGIGRRRAPWPWLVGLGVALVPACYMASVKLCDNVAGTCITGEQLDVSQQAIVSVIAFALAAAALIAPPSAVRDAAFRLLVLFGQVWLTLKLNQSHERAEVVMLVALMAGELAYELFARVRAARERAAESSAALA